MSDRWINRVLLVAAIAVVLGLTMPALAQEAEEDPAPAPMTEEEKAIDEALKREPFAGEITVTSRRREELMQEVPIAVSVVAGEQLHDVAASHYLRAPGLCTQPVHLPGTQPVDHADGVHSWCRTVGPPVGRGSRGRTVHRRRLHRPRAGCAARRLRHLEGRGAARSAGYAVRQEHHRWRNQICDEASFEHVRGPYHLEPGNLQHPGVPGQFQRTARSRTNCWARRLLPSSRATATATNLYQNRDVSNKDTTAYRLALEWMPSDKVSIRADYDHTKDDAEPVGLTRLADNPFCLPIMVVMPAPAADNLFDTESGIDPVNNTKSTGYSLTLKWDINAGSAVQIDHRLPGNRHPELDRLRHRAVGDRRFRGDLLRRSDHAGVPAHLHRFQKVERCSRVLLLRWPGGWLGRGHFLHELPEYDDGRHGNQIVRPVRGCQHQPDRSVGSQFGSAADPRDEARQGL